MYNYFSLILGLKFDSTIFVKYFKIIEMKRIITLCILLVANSIVFAQNSGAFIVTTPDTVNIGEIALNELTEQNGKVEIVVLNKGNAPLILNIAEGCCGTNIKEWPKAPILPGKSAIIKVEFRIEPRPQVVSRTVTIKSNASNAKVLKVPITGVIIESKAANEITL